MSRSGGRPATASRVCAQRLTDAHGLDGFTMDELAEAAEVSRRTLFNYFPSKIDAVLGEHPEISDRRARRRSVAGGPHGNLVEDLAELARAALAGQAAPTASRSSSVRRVLHRQPAAARRRPRAVRVASPRSSPPWCSSARAPTSAPTAPGCSSACCSPSSTPRSSSSSRTRRTAPLVEIFDDLLRHRPRRSSPDPTHSTRPPRHRSPPMATLLHRLGKTAYRRWPFFIAGWLVAADRRRHRRRRLLQADERRLHHPGHPVREGRRPPVRALPRLRRRASTRPRSPSSSPLRRASTLDEPTYTKAVDALVGDLGGLPQMRRGRPAGQPGRGRRDADAADRSTPPSRAARLRPRRRPTPRRSRRCRRTAASAPSTFTFDVDTVADVEPATIDALTDAMDEARDAGLTVEANGSGSPTQPRSGGASELIGIAIALHRPAAHLRLARRRRPADPHRDLRRRPRHHRHHRDDRLHGHRLQHPDPRDDDRPRGRHRLRAVHPGALPHASCTTPTTARRRSASPSARPAPRSSSPA